MNLKIAEITLHFQQTVGRLMSQYPKETTRFMGSDNSIPSLPQLRILNASPTLVNCEEDLKLISTIVYALHCLPKNEAEVLWFCNFQKNEKEEVLQGYSRAGFYRLLTSAMIDFLSIIDPISEKQYAKID